MAGNVFQLFPIKETVDPVDQFMTDHFLDWAEEQGIDTFTTRFKQTAAGVMSLMRAMIIDEETA